MARSSRVVIDTERLGRIADLLTRSSVPPEAESRGHDFEWTNGPRLLANAYLAIVAICHQTSPGGERRLEGLVQGSHKVGWDYLKERFLREAAEHTEWTKPSFWQVLNPTRLSSFYVDSTLGLTLNRVNERTFL